MVPILNGDASGFQVVYFTVCVTYIILVALLIRFVTLGNGHLEGLRFYVSPSWGMLAQPAVWGQAATHVFYSLGLSMGCLMSLSSYNRFHYDSFR